MGYVAGRGVLDYLRGENLINGERLHGSISGLMGNPNDLAMNMVTFLPLGVLIAISRGRPLHRLIAGVIATLMTATIVFTGSRAGLLGLAAVVLVVFLEARKVRRRLWLALFVAFLVVAPLQPSWLQDRIVSITSPDRDATGSRQARKDLMSEAWNTFLDHPITGVGAGQFKNYNPPGRLEPWRESHNVLLQVAAELGIFGLLAFLVLIAQAVAALMWTRRFGVSARAPAVPQGRLPATDAFRPDERDWMRMHVSAMTASLVGWLVCAQFASLGYYWTFYYLFALIVAARELTKDRIAAARRATRTPDPPSWKERLTA
jgi:O-antigen ligase